LVLLAQILQSIDPSRAEGFLWEALRIEVRYAPAWRLLGTVLLSQKRYAVAAVQAQFLIQRPELALRREGRLLAASLASASRNHEEAGRQLARLCAELPQDAEALDAWCAFLFEHGPNERAAEALKSLTQLAPDDGAIFHNLGTVQWRLEALSKAVSAYQESLRLRPRYAATHLAHGSVFHAMGRTREAIEPWTTAYDLADDPVIRSQAEAYLNQFAASETLPSATNP
jgi:tetratricopeptide (TPR) repeat protein